MEQEQTFEDYCGDDDWAGDVFASEQGASVDLRTLLREHKLVPEGHAVVRADLWIGNDSPGKPKAAFVEAFLFDGTDYDDPQAAVENAMAGAPLPLKQIVVELTVEQALSLFVQLKFRLEPRDVIFEGVRPGQV